MEIKKSKLCFDAKIVRKILKKNPQEKEKYCRYCGVSLVDGCECQQPATICDIKPLRGDEAGRSVFVFENTPAFQKAFGEIMDEIKSKKDAEQEKHEFED